MRGAEDPADQLPSEAAVTTGFRLSAIGESFYVERLRNGLVSYRLAFNRLTDALDALARAHNH